MAVLTLRVVEDLGRVVLLAEWVDESVVENRQVVSVECTSIGRRGTDVLAVV